METCILTPVKGTSSPGIQKALDKTGTVNGDLLQYSHVHFLKGDTGQYLLNSRLFLNDNTKMTFEEGVTWKLMDNAPNFGAQVPIIGQKGSSITGLEVDGLVYDGNYANQGNTQNDHGVGYGNLFGFSNITNSVFRNVEVNRNEGDGWRLNGGSNLVFDHCSGAEGGHDFIHLFKCSGATIENCSFEIRANNAVRVRSSSNVLIDSCQFHDFTNNAWAPPVQLENILDGTKCMHIEMKNCLVQDTYGPGVWGIASVPLGGAAGVYIHHNTFRNCGMMPAANTIPGVGGMVFDGFTDVLIENNIFDGCSGNAVSFDNYIGKGGVKGCKATVRKNSIVNTRKAFYPGAVSGYAIANVLGKDYYTVEASENTFLNNESGDYYGAINVSSTVEGPEEEPAERPAFLFISCSSEQVTAIRNSLPEKQIFRRK
ncbi:Right handed beta helix region [Methanosarcina thermophila]|uniref:Right handed beta helix region n=1 Tax=Methanosarcina thermophila TaxID=2210 RepID=A0A1I7AER5_METTE|nr:right-handed parallel beta-helix repeat-containing protein [Methanosarcina thermophila]ALK06174.1 MAG: hypothetical protein AAY43_11365 [Methanosarcina sp. 795]NLU57570.1 hypothetical protein [Methanosarcina thermophila]SFT73330.1 Right handed beta helix region [Methanosarcina thermophila]BAW29897.1 conserved hypothetical protein [Methanosarcina thermophila]GLI14200.1 hypothetical protein MTHERMMSTA1_13260 [Methanosarcina thermophila MST-A1]